MQKHFQDVAKRGLAELRLQDFIKCKRSFPAPLYKYLCVFNIISKKMYQIFKRKQRYAVVSTILCGKTKTYDFTSGNISSKLILLNTFSDVKAVRNFYYIFKINENIIQYTEECVVRKKNKNGFYHVRVKKRKIF